MAAPKGLHALSTRPRTTVADPAAVVAENRLLGQPAPTAPNQVWVGDITYLPLVGGRWCYLFTSIRLTTATIYITNCRRTLPTTITVGLTKA